MTEAGGVLRERVVRRFEERFGGAPELLVRAPGRVNLIGEHTDYNDGFVLPMAIDRELWVALRPRRDGRVLASSLEFGAADFGLADLMPAEEGWIEYVKGVAWALKDAGHDVSGWEGVLGGNVPVGAGLSSSAALEMATLRAFLAVEGAPWAPDVAARLGQRVENRWIGVNSGIMDQLIVAAGQAGHALLIDCRSLTYEPVPVPATVAVVILDTGTRRGLVGSAYNERRSQCEDAAAALDVRALRDADLGALVAAKDRMSEAAFRRARHVVSENARTLAAADALRTADLARLGHLMEESHASLRDDFEVSTAALDTMVEIAIRQDACYGARMTGAGFGGCAVAIVERDAGGAFADVVTRTYRAATGNDAHAHVCASADGAGIAP